MNRINWKDRIVIEPDIHHGSPCIKNTRIPVSIIIGSLADGMTSDEIIEEYPQLTKQDIYAVLSYAAEVLDQENLIPIHS